MKQYASMTHEEQKAEYDRLLNEYRAVCDQQLSLDMSRGKPSNEQLELSMPMLDVLHGQHDMRAEGGVDIRNYGQLDGIPEVKRIFADLLEVDSDNIMVGGNSSLNMMFDCINWAEALGIMGCTPWAKLDKVKFLCPVPGYDRHFSICELFGIEMINIPMKEDGPDMDLVREYVEHDDSVKGIWCVPKYSNPTGVTYSDDVVRAFAALKPAAKDFRIFWDNAYCVHHLSDTPDQLLNIFTACKEQGSEDLVYEFTSSSKISFSGAGIAVVAASKANMADLKSKRTIQTIGPNKVVQLMHARYFVDADGIRNHMKKHRALIEPKFNVVLNTFDKELSGLDIATYTRPNGGYFISFDTMPGCASRVGELCKQAGVVLTTVGATFPYGKDPEDKNIRVAPTFPSIDELSQAVTLFCLCVKMASLEKLMNA